MCQKRKNTTLDQATAETPASPNDGATSQCDACKLRGLEQCPSVTRAEQLLRIKTAIPLADSILTTRELPQG
jgi:hypothetical protein